MLVSNPLSAQNVLWADKVLGFSSEFRPLIYGSGYRTKQILGAPNKLPAYGDSPCAWSPADPDGYNEEWIKVGFEKAIPLKQVAVGENFNPGAIYKIYGYDTSGKEYLLTENKPGPVAEKSRMYRIFPTYNDILCNAVKIVLLPSKVSGFNQIDAIGISSDTKPIEASINLAAQASKDFKRENMGKAINSRSLEVAPVISSDGNTLYFTRSNHAQNIGIPGNQDIWYSRLGKNNQWSEAVNIGPPLNNADNNAITSISSDGKKVYLINKYKPDGTMEFGFSYSVATKTGWGFPQEIRIPNLNIDKKHGDMEIAVSPHGNVLLVSFQRPDTEGQRDLYVCFLKSDDTWSDPVNIGNKVNSAADEGSPFLALDNKTLYFASHGHSGYGEADLFVTRRLDDTWIHWSEPENLGPAINSPEWDGYFNIPAAGDYGYFCSGANTLGQEDIFRIRLIPEIKPEPVAIITGQIYEAETNKPIEAEVVAEMKSGNDIFTKVNYQPASGEFKLILPLKDIYTFSASQKGYFPVIEEIDLSTETGFRNIRKNIYLQPLKGGQQIRLSNTLFSQSSSEVTPTTFKELDKIVTTMATYPNMEILLEGHTDNVGEIQKNIQLSEDRVNEVKKYLISKGIDASRIQTKAWGPSKPIASNLTEVSRQKNRRVEFTILKI
ncbi:Peptidoglycan-associated lipoprotein [Dyadobacter sp. CECT 9275]|uniref:Peptidoglycan-associated lipoprotein n=2 Tax=Dyadobacter helix TaxID=2822344 RepID=A0A916N4X9_9BACT|nr:Peptidoglycan-associated lipoprotein [Dyadobacter sp. CECT 9275]